MKNTSTVLTIKSNLEPVIAIDRAALEQARYFVQACKDECQWFHRVKKIVKGERVYYRLYDIYIPKQKVTGATVQTDAETFAELANEVKEKTGGYNAEFNEIFKSLGCWSHSHVNMGVSPSGTDNDQFKDQIKTAVENENKEPQVMLIFNKSDVYFSRVYDFDLGLLFENVPLIVNEDIDYSYINDAIENKIEKYVPYKTPTPPGTTTGSWDNVDEWRKHTQKKISQVPESSQTPMRRAWDLKSGTSSKTRSRDASKSADISKKYNLEDYLYDYEIRLISDYMDKIDNLDDDEAATKYAEMIVALLSDKFASIHL